MLFLDKQILQLQCRFLSAHNIFSCYRCLSNHTEPVFGVLTLLRSHKLPDNTEQTHSTGTNSGSTFMQFPRYMKPEDSILLAFSQQFFTGLCSEPDRPTAQRFHIIYTNGIFPSMSKSPEVFFFHSGHRNSCFVTR